MLSSTSSSRGALTTIAAFAATLFVLLGAWEMVLRTRSGASLQLDRPPLTAPRDGDETILVFGNCLMMTGIQPRLLEQELGPTTDARRRNILNIAMHEQTPLAYFSYLQSADYRPDMVITNVSSWINGTNFAREAEFVTKADILGLRAGGAPMGSRDADTRGDGPVEGAPGVTGTGAYRGSDALAGGRVQTRIEKELSSAINDTVLSIGHRYRLMDVGLFVGTLATTFDLDRALFQLNMQPWYAVTANDHDGRGWLGVHVRYRDDWLSGVDHMAQRSVTRLTFQRLLTDEYWAKLEQGVHNLEAQGTQVVLVRMPEHPLIRVFNDERYQTTPRVRAIAERTGARYIDLSTLGIVDGVRLFDAVHPDADAALVITRTLAAELRGAP